MISSHLIIYLPHALILICIRMLKYYRQRGNIRALLNYKTLLLHTSVPLKQLNYKLTTYIPDVTTPLDQLVSPRSIILTATPNSVLHAEKRANDLISKYPNSQLLFAIFDTVGIIPMRSGISELWCHDVFSINNVRSEDSSVGNHWRHKQGDVQFSFKGNSAQYTFHIPLANTLFVNDRFETLFLHDPQHSSPLLLKGISIELPKLPQNLQLIHTNNLIPVPTIDELFITDCKHNMIKLINNRPLSSVLQTNEELMSTITKESRIFAYVQSDTADKVLVTTSSPLLDLWKRHEVVGGGGSWGSKSHLLALKPDKSLSLRPGLLIKFYYLDPSQLQSPLHQITDDSINFISSSEKSEKSEYRETSSFAIGSETGFTFNGIHYNSIGDLIQLKW